MAKLTGPLLSLTAHGTVADVLTFSKRSSSNCCRYQSQQKDYENEARLKQRVVFWAAIQWWHDLNTAEKQEWVRLGNLEG